MSEFKNTNLNTELIKNLKSIPDEEKKMDHTQRTDEVTRTNPVSGHACTGCMGCMNAPVIRRR